MVNYSPVKLIEYVRDGLIEQEHYGFIVICDTSGNVKKLGDDSDYPFYLRSCAKPLQASLILDFEIDKYFNLSSKEIAVCCASHAGEPCHVETIKGILDKIGLDETFLKCGLHKPLSKSEQEKMLIAGETETTLHNNCSGKHTMMLAICKKMGYDLNTYNEKTHPLQIAIKNKIYSLCEIKEDYPDTKDGCGVPIYSMPLKNMVKGYLNLFFDEKYSILRDAFVQNPYIIGGEDRLDTAIMSENNKLIAKVGAGGLCIAVNLEKEQGLVVKIIDCDMKARAICLIETLRQLNWLTDEMLNNDLIKAQNKKAIMTHHGENIGQAKCCFSVSS